MIGQRTLTVALWPLLLGGTAAVVWASLAPTVPSSARAAPARTLLHSVETPWQAGADTLSRVVIARDLFRLGRQPAAVRYDPERGGAASAQVGAPSKPGLRLVGLVTGSQRVALIEGFPGIDGARVVRIGDQIARFTIAAIEPGRVRVVGMDTVWVLTLRRP